MRLYIDPGTGSMLFTILIGLIGTAGFLLRKVFVKMRFLLTGGAKHADKTGERMGCVIFSDSKRYWNSFEPICDEFEKRGEALTYLTASPDDPALDKHYEHVKCEFIGEGNRAFVKLNFLKADVLLATTPGLQVYQWKRSKDVKWYVHVPHAPDDITKYRMFGIDYYDALLLSGKYQIKQVRALERLRGLSEKELKLVGVAYLDGMMARFQASQAPESQPTTLLLAPSWGESSLFGRYGGKIIRAALDTGFHVIIRPHPQSFTSEKELIEKLMRDFPNSESLEWNRDNDNFEVLRRSDIMISDFSGVMFDFALVFGRPIIYSDTTFDSSPYDAAWLDEELWSFKVLKEIGLRLRPEDLPNLKALVEKALTAPEYRQALERARAETWAHMGEAAARIADYMIEKQKSLAEKT